MARTVRNAKIDTRSARSKLSANKSIYWTSISPGCALGYRKGAKGGVWVAKYVGYGLRKEKAIGPTDDVMDADGVAALSFAQSQEKAREWALTHDDATGSYRLPAESLHAEVVRVAVPTVAARASRLLMCHGYPPI